MEEKDLELKEFTKLANDMGYTDEDIYYSWGLDDDKQLIRAGKYYVLVECKRYGYVDIVTLSEYKSEVNAK